jgi:glucose-1-phosphate thymidylyltransferase
MKALVLAAGKGTRLKPLTNTQPKHLIPVANKPILFYVLEKIKEAGITDIGLVASPSNVGDLKSALLDGSRWDVSITYIIQSDPKGLADGVRAAQGFLGDSVFLLFLGDNLIEDEITTLTAGFDPKSKDASIILKAVADPRAFGVAEVDASGNVVRVIEKPKQPTSDLAMVGAYIFTPEIHTAIHELKPSRRGEYEITDAIQKLIETGKKVSSHVLTGWWLDTGKKEDLLAANRVMLDKYLRKNVKGQVDARSQTIGAAEILDGTRIENSVIRGPISIAENCLISDSIVGPYTSIGSGTTIERASVKHSILLNDCRVVDIPGLTDSVIGRNVSIIGTKLGFDGIKAFVGDQSTIDL